MSLASSRGSRAGIASVVVSLLTLLVGGCGGGSAGGGDGMTIAYQPGIGYAQLLIIKQEGWLEEDLPETEIAWEQLSSGSAIRDGMLAGDIQVGSGGVGPFLVGYSAGVDWKVLSALNEMDLWLMVADEQIQNLGDLGDGSIAMPAPDSIQAVVLRRGAEEQLGDAKALDNSIVSLAHPDGLQALLSGQISGHLTSPPFQFQEQDEGARPVLKSFDLFGPHTFNSVFVRQGYHDDNPEAMEALYSNIQEATELIESNPDGAAEILSEESGGETSAEEFRRFMTEEGVSYTTQPNGFIEFAEFMQQIGLIDEVPASQEELVFDNLKEGG
ncbi:MAG TPA: ABC transporter substrate-binding protein [Rubrobacteraceae bacterium]|nr:ABC transporter substrate-binding protein [Rubrobacteraceae bacterium]